MGLFFLFFPDRNLNCSQSSAMYGTSVESAGNVSPKNSDPLISHFLWAPDSLCPRQTLAKQDHPKAGMDTQRPHRDKASRAATTLLYCSKNICQNMQGTREKLGQETNWASGGVLLSPTPLEWHTVSHIISFSLIYRQSSHFYQCFHAEQWAWSGALYEE